MRTALLAFALMATPAFAQMVLDDVNMMIMEDSVNNGVPQDVAQAVADCFTENMTTDEAEAILDAEGLEAQQMATSQMGAYDLALACTAEAFQ